MSFSTKVSTTRTSNPMKACLKAALTAACVALAPANLFACAACYGASDAPMAKGMNWGIVSLLGIIGAVLGTFAAFFVFLGVRSARASETESLQPDLGQTPPTNL